MTIRKIQVEVGDAAGALAAARYPLEEADSPRAFIRDEDRAKGLPERANAMWLGSEEALALLGLVRGGEVSVEQLALALQGRHVDGRRVRRAGSVEVKGKGEEAAGESVRKRVVNSYDLTFSAPKSVSVLWSQADAELRAKIEQAMLVAANAALEHVIRTRLVVGGEETAHGFAASLALHVTARTAKDDEFPSPQLHVHADLVGVLDGEGRLRTPNSEALYKDNAMREAGAVGRAVLAEEELKALSFEIEACTGLGERYFEIVGVDRGLCERMSGRSRDCEAWVEEVEARRGGRLGNDARASAATATATAKAKLTAAKVQSWWDAQAAEFRFGQAKIKQLQAAATARFATLVQHATVPDTPAEAVTDELFEEVRTRLLGRIWAEGPSVGLGAVRSMVVEMAPLGMTLDQAGEVLHRMQAQGDLIALEGGRVTIREIRERELSVRQVAITAAKRDGAAVSTDAVAGGIAAAEANPSMSGHSLDDKQREAVELLTAGSGWSCLTGRAGTGKGPVLEAVVEAHRLDGWRVIATALDGATTQRLGHQIAASALNVEQLLFAFDNGLEVDERTLLLIDEASKIGLRHWKRLAELVESTGARLIAVGDVGQAGAIESPGMLDVMIDDESIPTARLKTVHRHRDPADRSKKHPWIGRKYLDALYEGRAADAIKALRDEGASTMHETRDDAMVGLVDRWEQRRRDHQIEIQDTVLVVYGSNEDVDLVNMLAQARRMSNGEIGREGVLAADRDYRLHVGDVVMMRESAYRPKSARSRGRRPRRVENGTTGIVEAVDGERSLVRVQFDQPGGSRRSVTIDLGELRQRHAASKSAKRRPPSLRLSYAGHPFPLQGATFRYVGSLWGHWSQSKELTYSGDARSKEWLDVHTDRESTGWEGTDDDRWDRLAERLEVASHRLASITCKVARGIEIGFRATHPRRAPELPRHTPSETDEIAVLVLPEPLLSERHPLGAKRLDPVLRRAATLARAAATFDDETLFAKHLEGHRALARLDGEAAFEVSRIETSRRGLTKRIERALASAGDRGTSAADSYRTIAKHHRDRLRALRDREETLAKEGRHPNTWLRAHRETLAQALASEHELTRRHHERTPKHPGRASQPQEHDASAQPDAGLEVIG